MMNDHEELRRAFSSSEFIRELKKKYPGTIAGFVRRLEAAGCDISSLLARQYREGATCLELKKKHGIVGKEIKRFLHSAGIEVLPGTTTRNITAEQFDKASLAAETDAEIARILGVKPGTIPHMRHRFGFIKSRKFRESDKEKIISKYREGATILTLMNSYQLSRAQVWKILSEAGFQPKRGRSTRPRTDEEMRKLAKQIAQEYQEGAIVEDLRKQHHLSRAAVEEILAGAGIKPQRGPRLSPKKGRKVVPSLARLEKMRQQIIAEYANGETITELMKHHNLSRNRIRAILVEADLDIRRGGKRKVSDAEFQTAYLKFKTDTEMAEYLGVGKNTIGKMRKRFGLSR